MLFRIVLFTIALALTGCQSATTTSSADRAALHQLAYAEQGAAEDGRWAAIVVDADSGRTLHSAAAEERRYPASLTKMMTLYLLFEELDRGRLRSNSELLVSANAASQPPTKLGLRAGSRISVEDAILALAVRSANDIAVAVAENISGSEAAFAERMTRTAHGLGMRATTFRNASGLPDPGQMTTARDMAILARALQQHFPRYYKTFSVRSFTFNGKAHKNTNALLGQVNGMDGIKTGYIRASGYNLATSVERDGRRIIVVVFGGHSGDHRNRMVTALVEEYLPERSGWFASR